MIAEPKLKKGISALVMPSAATLKKELISASVMMKNLPPWMQRLESRNRKSAVYKSAVSQSGNVVGIGCSSTGKGNFDKKLS